MTYVGGMRQRLIHASAYNLVHDSLEALGWLDEDRKHLPITVISTAHDPQEQIALNTIVVTDTFTNDDDAELGSSMGDIRTTYYVDIYGENDTIAKHLAYDIKDILRGRFSSIGRSSSVFSVYDYSLATPTIVFACDIEDVVVDRPLAVEKQWQKHMFMVRFDVLDAYMDETDDD